MSSSVLAQVFGATKVLPIPSSKAEDGGPKEKPAHWENKEGTSFHNPWPSFRPHGAKDFWNGIKATAFSTPSVPKDIKDRIPSRIPTWGLDAQSASTNADKIKATWLGHACFLVELPVKASSSSSPSRGARILFDPVFSDRCSPSQHIGPKRFTEPPCKISEIPDVDAVVISHNHYDHLDTHTITELNKRDRPPHFFAPLGNGPYFRCLHIPEERIHVLDWWEGRRVEIETGSAKVAFDVTCTPAQHFTGRGIFDRFKTLWASWVVQDVSTTALESSGAADGVNVYFAGDTGYRAVRPGQDEEKVPYCPAFEEIGKKFGSFDFAMIPIGAYQPRDFMSPIHCAPQDSVRVFKDINAKKALGMHWGTWILTTEDVTEPPSRLAEECKKAGIEDGAFSVCDIGETLFF